MKRQYDFSGWATRFDIPCTDGRTIRDGAFKECDGVEVPLVWMHQHNSADNVLGHALLEYRPGQGVYAYGSFNQTESGQNARELVGNRDVTNLSIYANQLKQSGGNVLHGVIREVSLVLAGANRGAVIENVLSHGEISDEEAIMYNYDDELSLEHGEIEVQERQSKAPEPVIEHADAEKPAEEEEDGVADKEKTVKEVFDGMTEEQKNVVYYLVGMAAKGKGSAADDEDEEDDEETEDMKHNVFDNDTQETTLSHADYNEIFKDAKRLGSLKEAVEEHRQNGVLAHAVYNDDGTKQTYGVANVDYLFPDYRTLDNQPNFIDRNQDWVKTVMSGVRHSPFSRVKSVHANITMDEARAKGYVKGNRKADEVFTLLKRSTDPQTVYKRQKMDRDDIIDITDFDVVAWIKGEMRGKLDEELARAMLVGDGRSAADDDKIDPSHIRPIYGDDELYTIPVHVTAGSDDAATVKAMIRAFIKARKKYRGSGNLTFFTTEDWLSEALLLENDFGQAIYADETALARKLRVNKIVTSPALENQTSGSETLAAIAVDLKDYNVGADKGGSVEMFDDFDIDFNQYKYLIETRCSGALVAPFSAMAVVIGGSDPTYTTVTPSEGAVPATEGWYEKQGEIYRPSKDSAVVTGKTYYEKA